MTFVLDYINVTVLLAETCKKKWKNARDTYMKKKREEKEKKRSGQGAQKGTSWPFMDHFKFLDDYKLDIR